MPDPFGYAFLEDWFSMHAPVWTRLWREIRPSKVLEIGSFEGRSTVWLIENLTHGEKNSIYCIDNWQQGAEGYLPYTMSEIEKRFRANVEQARRKNPSSVEVSILRGKSDEQLVALLNGGHRNSFDWIYVDGSHNAPDVLSDLVLSFQLCRAGGLIVCDDYLLNWEPQGKEDLFKTPKMAIDAFTTIYRRKSRILPQATNWQVYIQKMSD
jgi:predicted O-methyltransferase YrrM